MSQVFAVNDTRRDEYFHWDDLRHRTAPNGLSLEEYWALLKLNRKNQEQPIPLNDCKGRPFTFWQTSKMSRALHQIDLGAGGNIGIPEPVTNSETRNYYYVNSLLNEAITSSQLEGAVVTRKVAKEMIRSRRTPTSRHERMIFNNYRTMENLATWKDQPLTPALVLEIQSLITEGTLDDESATGRFRTEQEKVEIVDERDFEVMHTPPPASELEERLIKLCAFANEEGDQELFIHPVVRAITIHFWLAYDHPFVDDNGRTARALFYWLMLRKGFWLFEFISISEILVNAPIKYARSYLLTETDDNDLNYFIHYQLKVIERAVENLHTFIAKKSGEISMAGRALADYVEPLNYRQEALINRAIKHPNSRFTTGSHQMSHKVAYGTARSDLMKLEKLGLLEGKKSGRTTYFYPAKDLSEKLSGL
jgi:Fic family protein